MAGQGGALAFSKAFDCCDSEHEESQLMVATRAIRHGPWVSRSRGRSRHVPDVAGSEA